jgi:hypothetical protein
MVNIPAQRKTVVPIDSRHRDAFSSVQWRVRCVREIDMRFARMLLLRT